jgi:perosamine synthetase
VGEVGFGAMSTTTQTRISVAAPMLDGNEAKYVADCIAREWISAGGEYSQRFERDFADYCTTRHAITCSNGTVAIHLALLALGVGPGDEVIVPTLTYIATANAVLYCGATPVFVDSEPGTMNMDPAALAAAVTPRTRGIIPVHLYGHPADMDPILAVARQHGLFVLEDAAEAHGARYRGRRVGSLGNAATFSFFGNKVITTGEGGMVTTDDDELAERMTLLRGQGMDKNRRYWFPVVGYNYRLTNLQAAVGVAQLERIDHLLELRAQVARWYDEELAPVADLLDLPVSREWASPVTWMYTVVLSEATTVDRDDLIARLEQDQIETRPVFHPLHIMPPYAHIGGHFPVAERLGARGLNLPTHPRLSRDDVARVSARLRHHLGR